MIKSLIILTIIAFVSFGLNASKTNFLRRSNNVCDDLPYLAESEDHGGIFISAAS